MSHVHMTLQGKGGVGKSMIASFIGQYLLDHSRPLLAIDTDPVNATLAAFNRLNTRTVELLQGSQIDGAAFDTVVDLILDSEADAVVDNGASSFIPLSNYLIENPVVATLEAHGRTVIVHSVITGGSALLETLDGFRQVAANLSPSVGIVVWLNEFFGPIEDRGKGFAEMKTFQDMRERVRGIVTLPRRTLETFGRDVREMTERHLTFTEAIADGAFRLMAKQRLKMVRDDIYAQLAPLV
ncbi:MAG TPA: conjugal transfer protein TraL [Patescibacteria group bacterium]|nr:conjugal transfer protein TraL [Patescibacteria group bacterium]